MSAFESLIEDVSERAAEMILEKLSGKIDEYQKNTFRFCYSEEEAAKILGFQSVRTLRRERDEGAISYSTYRGKTVYQPHHLLNYLKRNEVKNGKQDVTLEDVLGTTKNVLKFPEAA